MRVAVTGSSGLIGTALRRSLADDGHEVVRVVRAGRTLPPGPVIEWDLAARTIDAAALAEVDAVVHLAGESIGTRRLSNAKKREIADSRIVSTTLLAETLAELGTGPRTFVSGSGVNYYGDRGEDVLTERSAPGPADVFLTDLAIKWEAATLPAADAGIRTAIIRTGIVLDADAGAFPKMALPFKLGLGGRIGDGRQYQPWIQLEDEVGAIRFLLDHDDASGPFNLAAPEPVTNATLTEVLGKVLHRPTFLSVPRFGPRLLLGRELADMLLFTSMRAVPDALQAAGYRFRHPELEGALRATLGRQEPSR